MKLPKLAKHDTDFQEAENFSFHDSRRHATLHCWPLKRQLENLVQRGYLDEFIFDLEEDLEVRKASARLSTKALLIGTI